MKSRFAGLRCQSGLMALSLTLCLPLKAQSGGITIDSPQDRLARTDDTAAQIIDLHLQARGGLEAIRQIQSMIAIGELEQEGRTFSITHFRKAPNNLREESYRSDLGWDYLTITATDGRYGWQQEVFPEERSPRPIPTQEVPDFMRRADFHTVLMDHVEKGHVFKYMGETQIAGRPTYLVRANLSAGQQIDYYFDQKQFFIVMMKTEVYRAGRLAEVNIYPTRMKRIKGVWFPMAYEYRDEGETFRRLEYQTLQLNAEIPLAVFSPPRIETAGNLP